MGVMHPCMTAHMLKNGNAGSERVHRKEEGRVDDRQYSVEIEKTVAYQEQAHHGEELHT